MLQPDLSTGRLIDKDKEFELFAAAVGELSKHARNVLSVLLIASIYVLIAAFSGQSKDDLQLPILDITVPRTQFFMYSPLLLVALYSYLHLYVAELRDRLDSIASIKANWSFQGSPLRLLFPWILVFRQTGYAQESTESSQPTPSEENPPAEASNHSEISLPKISAYLLIWGTCPLVLMILWAEYVGSERLAALIPCVAIIISLLVGSRSLRQTPASWQKRIASVAASFFIIGTISYVPALREAFLLDRLIATVTSFEPTASNSYLFSQFLAMGEIQLAPRGSLSTQSMANLIAICSVLLALGKLIDLMLRKREKEKMSYALRRFGHHLMDLRAQYSRARLMSMITGGRWTVWSRFIRVLISSIFFSSHIVFAFSEHWWLAVPSVLNLSIIVIALYILPSILGVTSYFLRLMEEKDGGMFFELSIFFSLIVIVMKSLVEILRLS